MQNGIKRFLSGRVGFWIISITICFLIYAFRAPGDILKPYLWAEDGTQLIQDSIFMGAGALFKRYCGSMAFIQRLLALVLYRISLLRGGITYLPILMSVVFKLVTVCGILYFLSDRFSWLIESRWWRLAICIGIILTIPYTANDLVTSDGSLFHALAIVIYYVGIRILCDKRAYLKWDEVVALSIICLSSPAVPFIGAIAVWHIIKALIVYKRRESDKKFLAENILKGLIVLIMVAQGVVTILMSGRSSVELHLLSRMKWNIKSFVFFPFWENYHLWKFFFVGAVVWIVMMWLSRPPKWFIVVSVLASFGYMLYCSMCVSEPEKFYLGTMVGRYFYVNVTIATVMLGVAANRFWHKSGKSPAVLEIAAIVAVISFPGYQYFIPILGEARADVWKVSASAFDRGGDEIAWIPVGPGSIWEMKLPVSFKDSEAKKDMRVEIVLDDGQPLSDIPNELKNGEIIKVNAVLQSGERLKNLFMMQEEGIYQSTWPPTEDTADFYFSTPADNITEGYDICGLTKFVFYGQSWDGAYHKCTVEME